MNKTQVEATEKFTIKVLKTGKEYVQDIGRDQIFVIIGIYNSHKEQVATHTLGYKLETTEEEIIADLEKFIKNYNNEHAFFAKQKIEDESHAQADKTIKSIEGLELS